MPQRETGKRLSEYNNILKENDNLYRGVAKRLGLPECAFWILYTLRADSAALTQSEIGDLLYQPKQTVNSALKNLEAEGYIERLRTDDRRSKPIRLTERGAELAERTVDKVIAAERKSLLDLTEAEQDALSGCSANIPTRSKDTCAIWPHEYAEEGYPCAETGAGRVTR